MRKLPGQIGALGLGREKNRLGRGANLGERGEIFASEAPNDSSRSSRALNAPACYTDQSMICLNPV